MPPGIKTEEVVPLLPIAFSLKQKGLIPLSLFLIAYYVTNCMVQSYMSLFYTGIRFTSGQIGAINAGVALASMAFQPVWGTLGDRVKDRRLLLAGLAAASAASVFAYRRFTGFVPLLLLACLFACFYTSLQPMGDSIILKELDRRGQPFGPLRLAGGMAFALSGVAFGRLLDAPGRALTVPVCAAALCLLTALSALSVPRTAGGQSAGRRMRFSELFRQRELMALLAFMVPVQITMGYFYTFFSPHFVSLEGGTAGRLGLCYFISACSEIPFLLMSDRLFDRWGAWRLMRLSAATLALRWLMLGLSGSVYVVMASQVLHGWGFIVMSVCMAKYISRSVPGELQASGQMLLAIVSFGVARAFGNLAGGLLAGGLGRQNVFLACAGICVAALCLARSGPRIINKRGKNKNSRTKTENEN